MEVKTEITKEQYDELVVLRYPERYKRIEDSLPPQWIKVRPNSQAKNLIAK